MGTEIPLLFLAFVIVVGGISAVTVLARKTAVRRHIPPGELTRRRRKELEKIDKYLSQLDQAATEDEIDRLEQQRQEREKE